MASRGSRSRSSSSGMTKDLEALSSQNGSTFPCYASSKLFLTSAYYFSYTSSTFLLHFDFLYPTGYSSPKNPILGPNFNKFITDILQQGRLTNPPAIPAMIPHTILSGTPDVNLVTRPETTLHYIANTITPPGNRRIWAPQASHQAAGPPATEPPTARLHAVNHLPVISDLSHRSPMVAETTRMM